MAEDAELQKDIRTSMIIAAFIGISWFIGAEINTSLFLLFKRRRGVYFWSAALSSWGVVLQPLGIILADYGIWTDLKAAIVFIYLTWLIMVVPQSWLLYSRLHLMVSNETILRWIKIILIFTSIIFSVPTIIIGTIAQATDINPSLFQIFMAWDRVQLAIFFVQETALSLLYIWRARKYLHSSSLLSQPTLEFASGGSSTQSRPGSETKRVLMQLVFANVMVIALDIALLAVQYAGLFYIQGAFKPCVYGVKLKVEFAILNKLVETVREHGRRGAGSYYPDGVDNRGGGAVFGTAGGRPSPMSLGQPQSRPQPQVRATAFGESEWNYESPDDSSPHEQIGLGTLDHRPAMGPSQSQGKESQERIWDGQASNHAKGTVARPPTTAHQPQWIGIPSVASP